ncbi:MAG TPA: AbrB/MazE/SpoVT family DNA-binding domain-containing protein [Methanocella sp.]|nr:AbrB/MazE/SpoVT family DNA-binding domain-containing protein [Methanocella sp.]
MMELKKGKYIFGTVKVGERGQIVIPKEAREIFNISPGDELLILGDKDQGIAIAKADLMKRLALGILEGTSRIKDSLENEE